MKTTTKILTTAFLAATVALSSCKKEEVVPVTNVKNQNIVDKTAALKQTSQKQMATTAVMLRMVQALPAFVSKTKDYMKNEGTIEDGDNIGCANVTIDSSSSPRIATFDFGGGCTDSLGKSYSGSITVTYNNSDLKVTGTQVHMEFTNFTCDGITFNGTLDFQNNGQNVYGNTIGTVDFNMQSESTKDRFMLNGTTHIDLEVVEARQTCKYTITGSGTDAYGINFTQTTSSPIEQKGADGCDHFVTGILVISTGSDTEEINYGTGACDDQATSSINGGPANPFTLQ